MSARGRCWRRSRLPPARSGRGSGQRSIGAHESSGPGARHLLLSGRGPRPARQRAALRHPARASDAWPEKRSGGSSTGASWSCQPAFGRMIQRAIRTRSPLHPLDPQLVAELARAARARSVGALGAGLPAVAGLRQRQQLLLLRLGQQPRAGRRRRPRAPARRSAPPCHSASRSPPGTRSSRTSRAALVWAGRRVGTAGRGGGGLDAPGGGATRPAVLRARGRALGPDAPDRAPCPSSRSGNRPRATVVAAETRHALTRVDIAAVLGRPALGLRSSRTS